MSAIVQLGMLHAAYVGRRGRLCLRAVSGLDPTPALGRVLKLGSALQDINAAKQYWSTGEHPSSVDLSYHGFGAPLAPCEFPMFQRVAMFDRARVRALPMSVGQAPGSTTAQLEADLAAVQTALAATRAALSGALSDRESLLRSTSWRMTLPLRLAGAAMPRVIRSGAGAVYRTLVGFPTAPTALPTASPAVFPSTPLPTVFPTSCAPVDAPASTARASTDRDEPAVEPAAVVPTRAELLMAPLSRNDRIIEIGPSFNPLAPKSNGWNSTSIDYLTRAGLVARYSGRPGVEVDRIEEVDFIWTGGPLSDAVPEAQHGSFDALVASHVIEHTPDLIDFLDCATTLVKSEGIVVLAIPDKRYCFDYFQPLTTTGQLLEAHADRRSRHCGRYLFDHIAYAVQAGGSGAWGQHPTRGIAFEHQLESAHDLFNAADGAAYTNVHAWRFVPSSFELLLLELARLGETDWRVERITPAEGCEFLAWLRRGGVARAATLSREELAHRRMTLLKRTLLETQSQIGWLLAGETEHDDAADDSASSLARTQV
jgi:hypothetical protein